MKADSSIATPQTTHPPLAHDTQGFKLSLPDGTTHWRILRHTGGRPKPVPGHDMQPARFGLDLTQEDLLDLCGPGTYRIEALDQYGNRLACVTSVTIGADTPTTLADVSSTASVRAHAPNDLRIAMETIAQLSRSHSESLQSLATAQADWIKMLATAKAIPRNGYVPIAIPPAEAASADPPTLDTKPGWLKALEPAMPAIVGSVLRNVGSMFHRNAAPSSMNDNGSAATARLMRVRSRLTPTERQILDEALLDERIAEQVIAMLAERSEPDGLGALRDYISGSKGSKRKELAGNGARVLAVAEILTPEERELIMKLDPFSRQLIESQLANLSIDDGAELVRKCLATMLAGAGPS